MSSCYADGVTRYSLGRCFRRGVCRYRLTIKSSKPGVWCEALSELSSPRYYKLMISTPSSTNYIQAWLAPRVIGETDIA